MRGSGGRVVVSEQLGAITLLRKPPTGRSVRLARLRLSDGYWSLDRWEASIGPGRWEEHQPGATPVAGLRYDEVLRPLAIIEADVDAFPLGPDVLHQDLAGDDLSIVRQWVRQQAPWLQISVHDGGRTLILDGKDPSSSEFFTARLCREEAGWVVEYPAGVAAPYHWRELAIGPDEDSKFRYPDVSVALAMMESDTIGSFLVPGPSPEVIDADADKSLESWR